MFANRCVFIMDYFHCPIHIRIPNQMGYIVLCRTFSTAQIMIWLLTRSRMALLPILPSNFSPKYGIYKLRFFLKQIVGQSVFFLGLLIPVLDFWWCLPWISKTGRIPHALSHACNGFLRFTSGVTPADL